MLADEVAEVFGPKLVAGVVPGGQADVVAVPEDGVDGRSPSAAGVDEASVFFGVRVGGGAFHVLGPFDLAGLRVHADE